MLDGDGGGTIALAHHDISGSAVHFPHERRVCPLVMNGSERMRSFGASSPLDAARGPEPSLFISSGGFVQSQIARLILMQTSAEQSEESANVVFFFQSLPSLESLKKCRTA